MNRLATPEARLGRAWYRAVRVSLVSVASGADRTILLGVRLQWTVLSLSASLARTPCRPRPVLSTLRLREERIKVAFLPG